MTQETTLQDSARAGAENLLRHCVAAQPGETIAIIAEDPALGHYDAEAAQIVAQVAAAMGCRVSHFQVDFGADPQSYLTNLGTAFEAADHVVFFSRIGDQIRFGGHSAGVSRTMVYTLDKDLLASAYGTVPQPLMSAVKDRLEDILKNSATWRITCPLGTDIQGTCSGFQTGSLEFSVKLFPVAIFRPVPCDDATGQVAVAHWLMGTDTHDYDDDILLLDEPVMAQVEHGRVVGFEGPAAAVAKLRAHYDRVSGLFGVDGSIVGSWHAGIHPGATYPARARDNLRRWGSVAFANPRYLHFHTCGADPGEIAWSLFDATVELDGQACYDHGRFVFLDRPDVRQLCADYGFDEATLAATGDIGID